jgi:hypothetical protein
VTKSRTTSLTVVPVTVTEAGVFWPLFVFEPGAA